MVGRLVEEQEVGVLQEELREGDAHLPAAREVGCRLVEVLDRESESRQDLPGPRLQLIAAQMLEALLGMGILLEHAVELGSLLRIGDGALQLVDALLPLLHLGGRIHDLLQCRLLAGDLRLLLEVADRRVLRIGYGPLIGRLLPHEDLQEGCLARTVRADERPALPRIQLQGSGRVENAAAE